LTVDCKIFNLAFGIYNLIRKDIRQKKECYRKTRKSEFADFLKKGTVMSPAEIMREHIEFWTSDECTTLSREDIELVRKLADVSGVELPKGWGYEMDTIEAVV
jgi:hypothetical protein